MPKIKTLAAVTAVAATSIVTPLVSATDAQAGTTKQCAVIQSQTVGGYNWKVMPTSRTCSNSLQAGVSGTSYLVKKNIVVNYSARNTTTTEAAKATVHELTHHVEYRTTAGHRAKLYAYLGVKNPTGNYFAINDKYYYSGPLKLWKQSPRERLAESVVNCTYGTPNHTGMALVSKAQCKPFLNEFRASLAAAR